MGKKSREKKERKEKEKEIKKEEQEKNIVLTVHNGVLG